MANDRMTVKVEAAGSSALIQAVAASVKDVTKLRADHVELVLPGSLPNDGKVIEDARRYD
jgi:phenylacetate-CoA ligase